MQRTFEIPGTEGEKVRLSEGQEDALVLIPERGVVYGGQHHWGQRGAKGAMGPLTQTEPQFHVRTIESLVDRHLLAHEGAKVVRTQRGDRLRGHIVEVRAREEENMALEPAFEREEEKTKGRELLASEKALRKKTREEDEARPDEEEYLSGEDLAEEALMAEGPPEGYRQRFVRPGTVVFTSEILGLRDQYVAEYQTPYQSGALYRGVGRWLLQEAYYTFKKKKRYRDLSQYTARWKRVDWFDTLEACREHLAEKEKERLEAREREIAEAKASAKRKYGSSEDDPSEDGSSEDGSSEGSASHEGSAASKKESLDRFVEKLSAG